ncbi:MAG: hypothetical protein LBC92_02625, partial [Rickettsiales bacterium]|nr:hypothetical protein [Rickettsiales bacterium]
RGGGEENKLTRIKDKIDKVFSIKTFDIFSDEEIAKIKKRVSTIKRKVTGISYNVDNFIAKNKLLGFCKKYSIPIEFYAVGMDRESLTCDGICQHIYNHLKIYAKSDDEIDAKTLEIGNIYHIDLGDVREQIKDGRIKDTITRQRCNLLNRFIKDESLVNIYENKVTETYHINSGDIKKREPQIITIEGCISRIEMLREDLENAGFLWTEKMHIHMKKVKLLIDICKEFEIPINNYEFNGRNFLSFSADIVIDILPIFYKGDDIGKLVKLIRKIDGMSEINMYEMNISLQKEMEDIKENDSEKLKKEIEEIVDIQKKQNEIRELQNKIVMIQPPAPRGRFIKELMSLVGRDRFYRSTFSAFLRNKEAEKLSDFAKEFNITRESFYPCTIKEVPLNSSIVSLEMLPFSENIEDIKNGLEKFNKSFPINGKIPLKLKNNVTKESIKVNKDEIIKIQDSIRDKILSTKLECISESDMSEIRKKVDDFNNLYFERYSSMYDNFNKDMMNNCSWNVYVRYLEQANSLLKFKQEVGISNDELKKREVEDMKFLPFDVFFDLLPSQCAKNDGDGKKDSLQDSLNLLYKIRGFDGKKDHKIIKYLNEEAKQKYEDIKFSNRLDRFLSSKITTGMDTRYIDDVQILDKGKYKYIKNHKKYDERWNKICRKQRLFDLCRKYDIPYGELSRSGVECVSSLNIESVVALIPIFGAEKIGKGDLLKDLSIAIYNSEGNYSEEVYNLRNKIHNVINSLKNSKKCIILRENVNKLLNDNKFQIFGENEKNAVKEIAELIKNEPILTKYYNNLLSDINNVNSLLSLCQTYGIPTDKFQGVDKTLSLTVNDILKILPLYYEGGDIEKVAKSFCDIDGKLSEHDKNLLVEEALKQQQQQLQLKADILQKEKRPIEESKKIGKEEALLIVCKKLRANIRANMSFNDMSNEFVRVILSDEKQHDNKVQEATKCLIEELGYPIEEAKEIVFTAIKNNEKYVVSIENRISSILNYGVSDFLDKEKYKQGELMTLYDSFRGTLVEKHYSEGEPCRRAVEIMCIDALFGLIREIDNISSIPEFDAIKNKRVADIKIDEILKIVTCSSEKLSDIIKSVFTGKNGSLYSPKQIEDIVNIIKDENEKNIRLLQERLEKIYNTSRIANLVAINKNKTEAEQISIKLGKLMGKDKFELGGFSKKLSDFQEKSDLLQFCIKNRILIESVKLNGRRRPVLQSVFINAGLEYISSLNFDVVLDIIPIFCEDGRIDSLVNELFNKYKGENPSNDIIEKINNIKNLKQDIKKLSSEKELRKFTSNEIGKMNEIKSLLKELKKDIFNGFNPEKVNILLDFFEKYGIKVRSVYNINGRCFELNNTSISKLKSEDVKGILLFHDIKDEKIVNSYIFLFYNL